LPPIRAFIARCASTDLLSSFATGVGHPEQSLPDVRRADAVCAQYRRPAGVTFRFQVCENSIDPSEPNRSLNLFAKDCVRATLADKPKPVRPKMSLVSASALSPCGAEGLAGARACPNRSLVTGKSEGVRPAADPGEEMTLFVSGEIAWLDVGDGSLVHSSNWQ